MSEKRDVTTFRVHTAFPSEWLEGPVVSPDKTEVAKNLSELHQLLRNHGAILLYDKQWMYIPALAIARVLRGGRLFSLPWPLFTDSVDP